MSYATTSHGLPQDASVNKRMGCRAAFCRNMDNVLAAVKGRELPPKLAHAVVQYFRTKYTLQGDAQGSGRKAVLSQLPLAMVRSHLS